MVSRIMGPAVQQGFNGATLERGSKIRAYPGQTSTSILPHLQELLADGVDIVVIGTDFAGNDAGNNIGLATVSANYRSALAQCRKAGVPVLLTTLKPRASDAPQAVAPINIFNAWMLTWAQREGVPVADVYSKLIDSTGYLPPIYDAGDGTHPNDAGHRAIAEAIAPVLADMQRKYPFPPVVLRTVGLVSTPMIAGLSAVSTISGTPTESSADVSASGEIPEGKWLRLRKDNTAGTAVASAARGFLLPAYNATTAPFGWSPGDVLEAHYYVKSNTVGRGSVRLYRQGWTTENVFVDGLVDANRPIPFSNRYTVAADVTSLRLGLSVSASAGADVTAWLGCVNVFNITKLGLI